MPDATHNSVPGTSDAGVLDRRAFLIAVGALMVPLAGCAAPAPQDPGAASDADTTPLVGVALPDPTGNGVPGELFNAIERRRSVRGFTDNLVSEEDIARMLWAAQGVTHPGRGFRAAPSAGALYPLETYAVTTGGVRRYVPQSHELEQVVADDIRGELMLAALGQRFIAEAPVVFIMTGVYSRLEGKYGDRSPRYTHIEAGHAAQNLLLVAVHLGLGGVPVGAFVDDAIRHLINADEDETPLYLIPVGVPPG